jgi:hypothetical protein
MALPVGVKQSTRLRPRERSRYYLNSHALASKKAAAVGPWEAGIFLFCHIVPGCIIIELHGDLFVMEERISMATETSYGEDFRSIGQALEGKNVHSFELKRVGDWYILQGVPMARDSSFRSKLHKFKLRFRSGSDPESLTLALSEVEDLSRQGKAKRSIPGRMPDFRRLSNALRTIGTYLESKQAKLIELKVRPLTITLSYRDSDGEKQIEDRTIRSFYNLSIDLYEKRIQAENAFKVEQPG